MYISYKEANGVDFLTKEYILYKEDNSKFSPYQSVYLNKEENRGYTIVLNKVHFNKIDTRDHQ